MTRRSQFVRKLSGFAQPSKANEAAFDRAVEDIAAAAEVLIASLVMNARSRTREAEVAKAKERSAMRFRRVGNDRRRWRHDRVASRAILQRLQVAGIAYRSNVRGPQDMQVSHQFGGRNVYWNEPEGHQWEMLTVSYARPQA